MDDRFSSTTDNLTVPEKWQYSNEENIFVEPKPFNRIHSIRKFCYFQQNRDLEEHLISKVRTRKLALQSEAGFRWIRCVFATFPANHSVLLYYFSKNGNDTLVVFENTSSKYLDTNSNFFGIRNSFSSPVSFFKYEITAGQKVPLPFSCHYLLHLSQLPIPVDGVWK